MSQSAASKSDTGKGQDAALVQGSLSRAIWTMSWPLLLTTVSTSIIGLVDMQMAGTLGSPQQAAVGIAEQILFVFMVFIMSISVGTTAMVSRAAGARNQPEVIEAAAQSLSLSFGMGLLLSAVSLMVAHYGVRFFSQSPNVVAQGELYLSVYSLYLIPFSIASQITASFRGIGDAKTPLVIICVMTLVAVSGDYLTVLHNWPVPGLGIRGIAFSGLSGSASAAVVGLLLLRRSSLQRALKHLFPVRLSYIKRILNVGVPSAIQRLAWATSVFVLFKILASCPNPTEAIASWTIGMRIEGLIFMPLMALSLAVSSIVGQNLGAAKVERAVTAGWHVTSIGIVMMVIMGAAMFCFASPLAHFMSQDPQTIAFTTGYLRINSMAEPFLALGMVLSGALQGAGDTRTPMWITISTNWVLRLPLAWYLVVQLGWGPNGAWYAMITSVFFMGLLTAYRFQSKAWIKTQV